MIYLDHTGDIRQETAEGAKGKGPAGTRREEQESEVKTCYMLLLLTFVVDVFIFVLICFVLFFVSFA